VNASSPLTLEEIRSAASLLTGRVLTTPVVALHGPEVARELGESSQCYLKLELFQLTGTFKVRAALLNVLALSDEARRRGLVAVQATMPSRWLSLRSRSARVPRWS